MIVFWDITSRCNLACRHCYNSNYFSSLPHEEDLESIKAILHRLKHGGAKRIHLLGGEPFYRSDIMEICRLIKELGVDLSITTNGTLIDSHVAEELLSIGIDQVAVSLDGPDGASNDFVRGAGAYERALEGLRNLTAARKNKGGETILSLTVTITACITDNIADFLPLASSLELDGINFQFLTLIGRAQHDAAGLDCPPEQTLMAIERLMMEYKKGYHDNLALHIDGRPQLVSYLNKKYDVGLRFFELSVRCEGGRGQWLLTPQGIAHPCSPMTSMLGEKYIKSGQIVPQAMQIFKTDVSEIMSSPYFKTFRAFAEQKNDMASRPKTCRNCHYTDVCQPCPLLCTPDDVVEECEYAMAGNAALNQAILHRCFASNTQHRRDQTSTQVYDKMNDTWRILEGSGSEAWEMLIEGKSVYDIVSAFKARYPDIHWEQLLEDISIFVHELLNGGIICDRKEVS